MADMRDAGKLKIVGLRLVVENVHGEEAVIDIPNTAGAAMVSRVEPTWDEIVTGTVTEDREWMIDIYGGDGSGIATLPMRADARGQVAAVRTSAYHSYEALKPRHGELDA